MRSSRRIAAVLALAGSCVARSYAQQWNGAGADNNWTTSANWVGGAAPVNNGGANVTMAGAVRLTPVVNTAYDIFSLSFNSGAGAFSLSGSQLTLRGGGMTDNATNAQSISNSILVNANQTWLINSGGMNDTGAISDAGFNWTIDGAGATTLSGIISGGGGFTKTGSGTLTISGTSANTFTGPSTLSAGTLILSKSNGLAAIAGNLNMTGGTMNFGQPSEFGSEAILQQSGGTINFTANPVLGGFYFHAGGWFWGGGAFTLTGTSTNVLSFTGFATMGANFNFTGASGGGITNLDTTSSTYTGTLDFGGKGRGFNVNDNAPVDDIVVAGVIQNGAVIKNGAGQLALTGINTYSGGTMINEGTLRINSDASLGATGGSLTLNGGTLLTSASMSTSRAIAIVSASTIDTSASSVTLAGTISENAPLSKNGSGTLIIGGGTSDINANSYTGAITANAGTLILSKKDATAATNGDIIVNGGSVFLGTPVNPTVMIDGVTTSNIGTASNLTLNGGQTIWAPNATFGSVTFSGGQYFYYPNNPSTLTSNNTALSIWSSYLSFFAPFKLTGTGGIAVIAKGTNELRFENTSTFDLGGNNHTIDVPDFASGDDAEITAAVTNGGLIKTNNGTLVLSGNNALTYLEIDAGSVRLNSGTAAGTGQVVIEGGNLEASATTTIAELVGNNFQQTVTIDPGATLTVNKITTFDNEIVFAGNGTTGGTVILSQPAGFGFGSFDVQTGLTLLLGDDQALGTNNITFESQTALGSSSGNRTISSSIYFSDVTILAGGDINIIGQVTLANSGNTTLTVNNTTTLSGGLTGNSPSTALTKSGSGTLVLSGPLSLNGNITIASGTLNLSGSSITSNILNNGNFTYNSGSFSGQLTNDGTVTLNADFTAGNGLINNSNFTLNPGRILTLNGAGLDNEGDFVMTGGTLNLSTAGAANNVNNGTFSVSTLLNLNAATLTNNGLLSLTSSNLSNGTIINGAGGIISGSGSITAALQNSGTIAPSGGILSVPAFTNNGDIEMTGSIAALSGGAITNASTIEGFGKINNPITNTGTIESTGGNLVFTGAVNNAATGTIRAGTGTKVLMQGASSLTANAGLISLVGGTLDTSTHALNNTGSIVGYGVLSTGGLTNNGNITLTGGTTTVNGAVSNASGKTINIKFQPAIFTGPITNNGTIKTTSTTVTFTSTYTGNNYISDPATNIFQNNVTITAGGSMTGGNGDVFNFSGGTVANNGNFSNGGTLISSENIINTSTFTQSGPQNWASGTAFTNINRTATFATDSGSSTNAPLTVNVTAGNVNFSATQHLASINISAGAAALTQSKGVLVTNALTISDSGKLDAGSGSMIVNYSANSPVNSIRQYLTTAFDHGAWDGPGLTSSTAAADQNHNTALGYVEASDLGLSHDGSFAGQSIANQAVLIKYTYYGDENLDGAVNLDDFSIFIDGFNGLGSGWIYGDFNYDGVINQTDFSLFIQGFNLSGAPLSTLQQALLATPDLSITQKSALLAAIPEPGTLSLLGICAIPLLSRRKR